MVKHLVRLRHTSMLCSNTLTQNTDGVPASWCPYSIVVQAPEYKLHQYGCMSTADDMDSVSAGALLAAARCLVQLLSCCQAPVGCTMLLRPESVSPGRCTLLLPSLPALLLPLPTDTAAGEGMCTTNGSMHAYRWGHTHPQARQSRS